MVLIYDDSNAQIMLTLMLKLDIRFFGLSRVIFEFITPAVLLVYNINSSSNPVSIFCVLQPVSLFS